MQSLLFLSFLFLAFFNDSEHYKIAYERSVSYYAIYTIVFSAWFIGFIIIVYQIRRGKRKPQKIRFDR
jgi:hypothetical protein